MKNLKILDNLDNTKYLSFEDLNQKEIGSNVYIFRFIDNEFIGKKFTITMKNNNCVIVDDISEKPISAMSSEDNLSRRECTILRNSIILKRIYNSPEVNSTVIRNILTLHRSKAVIEKIREVYSKEFPEIFIY